MKNLTKYSEFDWENLFKEDNVKIRKYMEELPRYIHVPGEDEIVLGHEFGTEFSIEENWNVNDNDDIQSQSWRNKNGANVMVNLLRLSKNWLMIQNAVLCGEERRIGFKVTAILAIASGRIMAALNVRDEYKAFALAHCKNVRGDLNEMEPLFRNIQNSNPNLTHIIMEQISALSEISEMLTDWIFALKKECI